MKILSILFMIFITSINLFAIDTNNKYYKNTNIVEINYGAANDSLEGLHDQNNKHLIYINSYNDILFNKYFSITSTINYTNISSKYSYTYDKKYKSEEYFEISELVANIYLTTDDIISAGIFSFKEGAFSEHSRIGAKQSDALMTMYYLVMPGVFYTHHFNSDHKIQIGYAVRNNNLQVEEDRYEHSSDGSDIAFLFTSSTIGKHTIKLNTSYSNVYYGKVGLDSKQDKDDSHKIIKMTMVGIGYEYDDREYTGNLLYSILAYSHTDTDSRKISPTGNTLNNNMLGVNKSFNFSEEKNKNGYSILLGAKKDFDRNLFGLDTYIGAEYFYASKNWLSYTTDQSNSNAYSWGNLGHSYYTYAGVSITPKCKISLNYRYNKYNHKKIPGGTETEITNINLNTMFLRLNYLF